LREYNLYDQLGELLSSLRFSERKIALMYKAAQARTGHDTSEARLGLLFLDQRLSSLPARESRLLDAYVAQQITQELYDQKSASLKHERIDIEKQIKALKSEDPSFTLELTKKIFEQGSTASKDFIDGTSEKKRDVLENLLWNLTIKDGKVAQIQFKTPFHVLANAPKNGSISSMLAVSVSNNLLSSPTMVSQRLLKSENDPSRTRIQKAKTIPEYVSDGLVPDPEVNE
jgi:multidrug efflux pump subunit AcrA (membrane-fusion protein)